ncbi:MAG: N-acetyltransferase [Alphaproteobacteria bacterium]|nr:N-acetyltransferase [Alphaproteobacteria bacterium]
MTETFTDHIAQHQYELHTEGAFAYAKYRKEAGTLYIDYVEAPPELRGTGAAGRLMEQVVKTAEKEGLHIVPICGYAASWLRRHNKAD